jgi:hypothetical protein
MRVTALVLAAVVGVQPLAAQHGSRLWRPDERVVITDFSYVDAVAVGRDRMYAVTRGGLGVYDRRSRRWELPITAVEGYPAVGIRAALVDPVDRSLWLGTMSGVTRWDPGLETFEHVLVPGGVYDLLFDRDDTFRGIYVRGRFGWQLLQRGSQIAVDVSSLPPPSRQLRAGSADAVLQDVPFAIARSALTLTDQRLRRFRYTAAAQAPENDDVFVGTDGYGVLRIDALTTEVERLPFGLLDASAGATVATEAGVWVGSGSQASRIGFTFVSDDLQRYTYDEGPSATGYRFRIVYDLVERDGRLVAATDAGVLRIDPGAPAEQVAREFIGPGDRVFTMVETSGGLWLGTDRGLVYATDDGESHRIDLRVVEPIYALAARSDTVWVGGARGLGNTWEGAEGILVPADVAEEPWLADPIIGLAFTGDTLVAATPDRIAWREPTGTWTVERVITGELGELTVVAGDDRGVWVGGTRGFGFYGFAARAFTLFNASGDLPGVVRDLAVGQRYLWVATAQGLVRFAKDALGR